MPIDFINTSDWLTIIQEATCKGLIVLMIASLCAWLLRRSAAATRHLIWCAALSSLVLLPLLSMILPSWQVAVLPDFSRTSESISTSTTPPPTELVEGIATGDHSDLITPTMSTASPLAGHTISTNPLSFSTWLGLFWLAGVLIVLMRYGLGLIRIWWITRYTSVIAEGEWFDCARHVARSLRLNRPSTLYFSDHIEMPLTWGLLRPVVILPAHAVDWTTEKRQIVLTHELAHIKRYDCLTQLFVQITCAMYWFNPLVWLAARQHRIERERACDDQVLGTGAKASNYADHLLSMARVLHASAFDSFATVAFARPSQLEGRLLSILDPHKSRHIRPVTALLTATVFTCALIPLAIIQPAQAESSAVENTYNNESAPTVPYRMVRDEEESETGSPGMIDTAEATDNGQKRAADDAKDRDATWRNEADTSEARQSGHTMDLVDEMAAIGYNNLTVDQLISLKTHGVTSAYIKQVSALGYGDMPLAQILAFRIHGITPAYIGQMNAAFDHRISADQLLAARIQGVSANMVRDVHQSLGNDLTLQDMISFRIHGVTRGVIDDMAAVGFTDLSPDDLTAVRIHGVTRQFIEEIRAAGFKNLTLQDFISFRIHGITPALAEDLRVFGFNNLSADELRSIKIHGVTPEFIREIHRAGYEDLSLDEFVSFRIQGITPAFIERVRSKGIKDLSARELIALKRAGIFRN